MRIEMARGVQLVTESASQFDFGAVADCALAYIAAPGRQEVDRRSHSEHSLQIMNLQHGPFTSERRCLRGQPDELVNPCGDHASYNAEGYVSGRSASSRDHASRGSSACVSSKWRIASNC